MTVGRGGQSSAWKGAGPPMRLLMLGPPGSGKGTRSERLAARYGVPHLSSGELLRAPVRAGTRLGVAAQAAMSRGDLIPDDLVIRMIADEVLGHNGTGGFVLDGFPRTVPQATAAYDLARQRGITLHAVILLEIPYDELINRLVTRGEAAGRADDDIETIRHRIEVYRDRTLPLVDYYQGRDILLRVDATGTIDEVTAGINSALDQSFGAGC
jgi:adenylate kinase